MNIVRHPEIETLLNYLQSNLQVTLKNKLVGIYLYGSLIWGDFDYNSSDIDLLVVTETDITEREFSKLNDLHLDLIEKFENWNDRIEIAYVSIETLKTFKTQMGRIAIISPGEPFNIKDGGIDWLINYYLIRDKSVTLLGQSPRSIIGDISKNEFLFAVKNQAREWYDWVTHTKESRPYQAYAVLTICRAFYVMNNGEQVSKKQAANWAQKKYPEWATLIENALAWRTDWQNKMVNPQETYPDVEKFVRQLLATIKD